MTVTKDTIIADIIAEDPVSAEFFFQMGMYCVGCAVSEGETVEQACAAHGVDSEVLIARLNEFFSEE